MSSLDAIPPERGDSRGVAPATTVALLVVITVVLSIVTITGVFVISDDVEESPPQTVVGVESHSDGMLRITHEGGDPLQTEDLSVVGPDTERDQFGDRTLTAGESIDVAIEESGTASVVWESGDTSTTLEEFQAPGMGNWTELRTKLEDDEDITLQHDYTLNSANYNKEVGSGWDPIEYSGVLDGNGHEIRDINITEPSDSEVGFIKRLEGEIKNLDVTNFTVIGAKDVGFISDSPGGTVSNVNIEDATVNSTGVGNPKYSKGGILVGDNDGTIQDSSVSGTVEGENQSVGGLVGEHTGTIIDSSADGNVKGDNKSVGGLVGTSYGKIIDSSADVSVTGTDWDVGGLVGNSFGNITESYATGDVTGGEYYTGGLVGSHYGNITESYATGDVDGEKRVGGLAGHNRISWYNNSVTITDSYATGDVIASGNRVGGLVGLNKGKIETSFAVGEVTGASYVGGLVGDTRDRGVNNVTDSYWDTDTTGQSNSDGGTNLTTADMTGSGALSNMFGSNNVWGTTGDYPVLQALDEQTQLDARD
jgi:FlaG/FlaF family flagellin (archaellin)